MGLCRWAATERAGDGLEAAADEEDEAAADDEREQGDLPEQRHRSERLDHAGNETHASVLFRSSRMPNGPYRLPH
jgi:hypothetical protein